MTVCRASVSQLFSPYHDRSAHKLAHPTEPLLAVASSLSNEPAEAFRHVRRGITIPRQEDFDDVAQKIEAEFKIMKSAANTLRQNGIDVPEDDEHPLAEEQVKAD